jgi:DNA-binding NtrC family response regulator
MKTTRRRSVFTPASSARFVVRVVSSCDPASVGRSIELGSQPVVFGRSMGPEWTIGDLTLSRRHFEVREAGGELEVRDVGASNPTYVDGQRLKERAPLTSHSVVLAGETVFVVERQATDDGLMIAHDADGFRAGKFLGTSWAADRIRRAIETAATSEGSVLLLGPTGSGKEVSARAVHELSDRTGRFVPVNCAAIPKDLAESELFGHARGAFTGADTARVGAFELAHQGTLFLDELGELPLPVQSKLLRVLEDGIVTPVGGQPRHVDTRVVAATNRRVENTAAFRQDLHARLAHWVIRLAPLRERRVDILPLFRSFAGDVDTTPEFDAALTLHDWPSNVRELQKLASRLKRLSRPDVPLDFSDLPPELRQRMLADDSARLEARGPAVEMPSRDELVEALHAHQGNINHVARQRGWHRMQIYRWMQKHGLDPASFRP